MTVDEQRSPVHERIVMERRVANEQQKRTALKTHLQAGNLSVSYVLRCDKEFMWTMRIETLIRSLPSIGKVKTYEILSALRIPANAHIGDLPMSKREELILFLAERFYKVNLSDLTPEQNRERLIRLRARETKRGRPRVEAVRTSAAGLV
jgi:hypothetical protein